MGVRRFISYYWIFIKHLGRRVWDTRGRELMSALLLAAVTFVVSWIFKLADALTAFQIAILSLVGWLSIFALGHLIHNPVALHDNAARAKAEKEHWGFGVLGIVIVVLIAGSISAIGMWWWVAREPKIILPSADSGALNAVIKQQ
jgi:hypothetical protein